MSNVQKLLEIVDELLYHIDEDGFCENGCSCGECDNCRELEEMVKDVNKIRLEEMNG